jgi:general secretion pathway protein D
MRLYTPVLLGLLSFLALLSGDLGRGYAARLDTDDKLPTKPVPAASVPSRKSATEGVIHLNFRDADLLQIINLMSELTGKNFLVDDKVKGKVTIIAPKPVSLDEAYQVFLSLLEIQGFTVVPQGPIIKIVPSREVKERPLPTSIDGQRPPAVASDEFVTQLIPLEYADPNEIRALLTPLVSKQSSLLAYPPTNTLILTDLSSNISRLLKIIRALDIESPTATLKVISLKYAASEQIAAALQLALEGLAQRRERVGKAGQRRALSPVGHEGRQRSSPRPEVPKFFRIAVPTVW